MIIDLSEKRTDILFVLFGVTSLGIIIGVCANILFESFYKSYEFQFTLLAIVFLILINIIAFYLIVQKRNSIIKDVKFMFTLDKNKKNFIDLPSHAPSVHSHVCFNKLSITDKNEIIKECKLFEFGKKDNSTRNFIDSLTIEIILSLIINSPSIHYSGHKDFRAISLFELPYQVRKNNFVQLWFKNQKCILPKNTEIKSFIGNELNITNNFFKIRISWSLGFAQVDSFSHFFLSSINDRSNSDCNDLYSNVKVIVIPRYWKLFSRSSQIYEKWINDILENLDRINWNTNDNEVILTMLENINKKLS